MTISALARQVGLRPSAIRYYEAIGLLAPPPRRSGQRCYDARALRRLVVIRQAQNAGFTLDEVRAVVQSPDGFAEQFQAIAAPKLLQLEEQIAKLRGKQELLRRVQRDCQCRNADQCGKLMLSSTLDLTQKIAPENPHLGR